MSSRTFTLKGILLWIIHDFPGYGCVVGVAHWKDMLNVQFVDQNSKVNIQLNFGSKHTLQHDNDYHKDTHTC
jgi:hypothetical protein